MTATPIPRTLALTLYGDLEASVIDELPPGRTPIVTRRMPEQRSAEVWAFVRKQVEAGRQAYIVYPIIEGDKDDQPELDFAKEEEPSNDPASPSETQRRNAPPAWTLQTANLHPPAEQRALARGKGNLNLKGFSPGAPAAPASRANAQPLSLSPAWTLQTANLHPPAEQRALARGKKSADPASPSEIERKNEPPEWTLQTANLHPPAEQRALARGKDPLKMKGFSPGAPAAPTSRAKPKKTKLRSATEMHAELAAGPLSGLKLGLLHGRMSADEKEVAMARFKRGEIDVLVATTVIEVGVDVPNAAVMVIEHAERFGLAQMHQLRGRVGRGAAKSFCVLLTGSAISPQAEERLDAMVRTQNGFELAELDLQQRGPGEFFGTRQAGLPDFRVANLARDRDLLELAKTEAARFVEGPPDNMDRAEIEAVWARLKHQWQRRYGLVEA